MNRIDIEIPGGRVQGQCADELQPALDAFVANFAERGEVGGSLCVHVDGEPKLDLWGGKKSGTGQGSASGGVDRHFEPRIFGNFPGSPKTRPC